VHDQSLFRSSIGLPPRAELWSEIPQQQSTTTRRQNQNDHGRVKTVNDGKGIETYTYSTTGVG
jgi:hypothetical protein